MTELLAPILGAPRAPSPPYDVKDRTLFRQDTESVEQGHCRLVNRKLAVLHEPLDEVPLSTYECQVLAWVACWETHTVAVLAALLRRARQATPLG
jgi:hypothetical protein